MMEQPCLHHYYFFVSACLHKRGKELEERALPAKAAALWMPGSEPTDPLGSSWTPGWELLG